MKFFTKKSFSMAETIGMISVSVLFVSIVAYAVTMPYIFENGTVANADEVNANFEVLRKAIGNNNSFRGYTSVAYKGDLGGYVGANQKCNAEYSGSHMCDSEEMILSSTLEAPSDKAWVRPKIVASLSENEGVEYTGREIGIAGSNYDCRFWLSDSLGDTGFYINSAGIFDHFTVCRSEFPIACCGE